MTDDKNRESETRFTLDIDFEEALERFVQTDPKEVAESIEKSKKKKPPGAPHPGGGKKVSGSSDRKRQPD